MHNQLGNHANAPAAHHLAAEGARATQIFLEAEDATETTPDPTVSILAVELLGISLRQISQSFGKLARDATTRRYSGSSPKVKTLKNATRVGHP